MKRTGSCDTGRGGYTRDSWTEGIGSGLFWLLNLYLFCNLCQSLRGTYYCLWTAGNGLLVGVFRVVDAVDEYGHFVQLTAHRFCDTSVRQTDRQTDRRIRADADADGRWQRALVYSGNRVNNTPLYSVQLAINACRPRKVVGRVPRRRTIGKKACDAGVLARWAGPGSARPMGARVASLGPSLGESWVALGGGSRAVLHALLGNCQ